MYRETRAIRLNGHSAAALALFSAIVVPLALAGCTPPAPAKSSSTAPAQVGHNMAGPDVQVYIPSAIMKQKPEPWDLSTPEKAVRSYLNWTDYAYRVADSNAATPTMSPDEAVRVDSYVQFNLERKKILDQQLLNLSIGTAEKSGETYVVPTKEDWQYEYRSVDKGNKVIGGPYKVSYDATYTVTRSPKGDSWVVNSLTATRSAGSLK